MSNKKENYSIVRANRAGVFFGIVKERKENSVVMRNVRKLHYWDGAAAVEELSMSGTKKPSNCRFTVTVPEIEIKDWIQILPCTDDAVESIKSVKQWKA